MTGGLFRFAHVYGEIGHDGKRTGAIRDVYDIWFYLQMNVMPDEKTLKKRLEKPEYSRTVNPRDYFTGPGIDEFYDFLRERCAQLSEKDIENELSAYLPEDEIQGLDMKFRAAFARL